MFQFDLTSLLPQSLKQQAVDAAVDFVSEQAKKFLSEEFSGKIKKLYLCTFVSLSDAPVLRPQSARSLSPEKKQRP